MQDNSELLNDLSTAFKDITVSTFGSSILQPEYFNKFVLEATKDQTILKDARLIRMNSHVVNIDRIGFSGRVLEKGVENQAPTGSEPTPHQEQLIAEEYVALAKITDQSLRRNIERQAFANTLVSMMGAKIGEDWEALAVWGDKSKYLSSSLLKKQDGWIKKANTKLYGTGTGKDFTAPSSTATVTDMLSAMLKEYPREYLKNRSNLRFYLNSEYFDMYIDEVGQRPTLVGDDAMGKNIARPYKGIPVIEAPVLNDTEGTDTNNGYGNVAMLCDPDNLVYGIFHEVTTEPEREAKLRRTDYVMGLEIDQNFENPNVGVVALADQTKPDVTPETRTVSVSVKDASEDPISSAKVTLTDKTDGTKTYNCTTGAAGGGNITSVPDGTYTVTATATNYQNYAGSDDFTVSSSSTSLDITMTAST